MSVRDRGRFRWNQVQGHRQLTDLLALFDTEPKRDDSTPADLPLRSSCLSSSSSFSREADPHSKPSRKSARVLIPDVFESRIEPIRNPKTGEEHRARIVLPNGFEFKEAEVANTVRFEVNKPHGVAMRHENSYAQLSAFDWSN